MKNRILEALEAFRNGYNCAQSVVSVYAQELGIQKNEALKLANPFGAGISYEQETCGAVTGALIVIGLKYGKGENGTDDDKKKTYEISRCLMNEFRGRNKSIRCRDLLDGLNMSTEEGMAEIRKQDMFRIRCSAYIRDVIEIMEKIFADPQYNIHE